MSVYITTNMIMINLSDGVLGIGDGKGNRLSCI
jgi:hypothetical protein